MSNKQTGEKKQEDGFMGKEETNLKKQLQDPRFEVVTASKKEKGNSFSDVGRQ